MDTPPESRLADQAAVNHAVIMHGIARCLSSRAGQLGASLSGKGPHGAKIDAAVFIGNDTATPDPRPFFISLTLLLPLLPMAFSSVLRSIGLAPADTLTNTSAPQRVVVIGAGFGGSNLCKGLEKQPSVVVTLIEPREFFLSKFGALRAAAQGGKWSSNVLLPIASILKNHTASARDSS